jgi:threonine dehydrogenase-like Zn-dependent dehydrogenase
LVRKAGKVALVGESEGYLNLGEADEAKFFTIYLSPVEYPSAIELIARKLIDVKGLISHKFNLDEFEKALLTIDNPTEKPLKVVITQ